MYLYARAVPFLPQYAIGVMPCFVNVSARNQALMARPFRAKRLAASNTPRDRQMRDCDQNGNGLPLWWYACCTY